jgi:magnesium-transporting ATPase (P-type)
MLSTSAEGLSEAEIALRIQHYGFNELPEPAKRSLFLRFTDQLTHFTAQWAIAAVNRPINNLALK